MRKIILVLDGLLKYISLQFRKKTLLRTFMRSKEKKVGQPLLRKFFSRVARKGQENSVDSATKITSN